MEQLIYPASARGRISAIPSKSDVHRLLLCAALADAPTEITVGEGILSEDIRATARCIRALGGEVDARNGHLLVTPINRTALREPTVCDCGESGSTARFLLPIAAVLGGYSPVTLTGRGRLPERPFSALCDTLRAGGAQIDRDTLPITVSGGLRAGEYRIAGNVSSQYITGLLLALPLLDAESRITLTSPLASAGYVDMTRSTLARFGIDVRADADGFTVPAAKYVSPGRLTADGDWSNAAFWLCAGAVGGEITVGGLDPDSRQGDRRIAEILRRFGAEVTSEGDTVTVRHGRLRAVTCSVDEIPDLVPPLAVVAALAEGESRFTDAGRLRLKESDRLATVSAMITALGGDARIEEDCLMIRGKDTLRGGTVESAGDHRIAMAAAIAAFGAASPVRILGAEAVNKSYPAFWQDLECLVSR